MSRTCLHRWSPIWLIAWPMVLLLALSGCYYSSGYSYSYSVSVSATADNSPVVSGMSVSLNSVYNIDNATVYITSQDWTVTTAPVAAVFALNDNGRDATLVPVTPGTYVVRYRTWYYTNYDYNYCYCTYATGYREAFVTVTVLPAPSV
ncbi:MAG TPA: hypothetical protein VHX44_01440 [Planctomycetota bacterium]|nr:hypothetical protein [Planctomycetota bacterium]